MSTMTKVFVVLTSVVAIVLSCLAVATAARWSNVKQDLDSYQQLYQAELVSRMSTQSLAATALAMKDDELRRAAAAATKKDDELREQGDQLAGPHFETHVAQGGERAESLRDDANFNAHRPPASPLRHAASSIPRGSWPPA